MRFFAPQGRHVASIGVKFGMEEGPSVPSYVPNFIPSAQRSGYRTPKVKFLVRFDQNVEYKRPTGAYGLRDFYEFCIICNEFQDTLAVKTWMDLLKGLYTELGGFKLRVSGSPPKF